MANFTFRSLFANEGNEKNIKYYEILYKVSMEYT